MPITTYKFSEEEFDQVQKHVSACGYGAFLEQNEGYEAIDVLKDGREIARLWLEPHDTYVDEDGDVRPRIYVCGTPRGPDDDKCLHGDTLEEALDILDGIVPELGAKWKTAGGGAAANGQAPVRWWCANLQNRQMEPDGCGGYRIVADAPYFISPGSGRTVLTGLHIAIPAGHAGLVTWKAGMQPGDYRMQVIEPSDRDEVKVFVTNTYDSPIEIEEGQEVARIHVVPCLALAEEADRREDVEKDAP